MVTLVCDEHGEQFVYANALTLDFRFPQPVITANCPICFRVYSSFAPVTVFIGLEAAGARVLRQDVPFTPEDVEKLRLQLDAATTLADL